ncbi:MAG: hypothetical protein IJZ75_04930 [Clostridia bacterium]|nr:hypothetical protein [Clostridia bacterium]
MIKRNRWVNIKVTGNGKGKINRSAVIFIVCQCIGARDINIDIKDKFVKITTDNLNHSVVLTRVIKAIGGLLIKDIGKEKYGIFIPFFRCKNPVIKSPDEYEYLFNRLSPLRVFLSI